MKPVFSQHIEITPGVCGGRPRIAGHRVRVQDVVIWHDALGLSPDEIVSLHDELSLADVYAALAFYHDHREEIRRYIDEDDALASALQAQIPSKVLQRLSRRDARGDPIPSG